MGFADFAAKPCPNIFCSLRALVISRCRLSQNVNSKPNCILRIELAEAITPKLADVVPLAGTGRRKTPKGGGRRASGGNGRARLSEVHVVEGISGFSPETQLDALGQTK